ncbi:hypothetical protein jhhlp_005231 [Lomentospora prolificans]|uniref:Uncharacterized protein n=1 Tax=Lomentospora prolificans TaxID=41688 RepID=A0A2N3N7B1_9PEZI|nr:hypothetical protein jhhlp_005231 [Lomentospora prolificans]
MAPIRRYLRITKYSVLECRIYLDNPALAQSWLLHPRDPVLPRIIECIQPLVLPKLREEKERALKRGTKKKAVKDIITADDFEVAMFLTETATRHSILMKHKHFRDKVSKKLRSNSSKLMGETREEPIDVDSALDTPAILQEEDDDEVSLDRIPPAPAQDESRKRHRDETEESGSGYESPVAGDDDDVQEIHSGSESGPPTKRARQKTLLGDEDPEDKKKMAMDISYEGFAIYGMVLCLVVKRRQTSTGVGRASNSASATASTNQQPTGHAMMENWISSTQVPAGMEDEAEVAQ